MDIVLVQRAQKGHHEAFAALFNLLHRPVLNYIYHMLGDQQAAEDITLDGQTAPIEGRNAEWTWWWIVRQDGVGHCWVWDQLVKVSGDTSSVPIILAPPTPTPEDSTPPTVSVEYSPTGTWKPDEYDVVIFSAMAEDDGNVSRIEIWLQPPGASQLSLAKTCTDTATCVYNGGPYAPGSVVYFAKAWDTVGNMGESDQEFIRIYAGLK